MSPYTTMDITRTDCLSEIHKRLQAATDSDLEMILFDLVGRQYLYNFHIVSDYAACGDWSYRYDLLGLGYDQ